MRVLRAPKLVTVILLTVWATGVGVIWWLMPVGPRDGWQPPRGDHVCGLLRDGRTLVTARWVHRSGDGKDGVFKGPVRLWRVDTGALLASHFSSDDSFESVHVDECTDHLRMVVRLREPHRFQLRLHDTFS